MLNVLLPIRRRKAGGNPTASAVLPKELYWSQLARRKGATRRAAIMIVVRNDDIILQMGVLYLEK
jgi:hypothetical protein